MEKMDEHTSHELAHKKGYEKGYADGKKDAVKYGLWTPLQINGHAFGVTCSECNTTWDDKSNYCPNCGADMRGEEDA